MSAPNDFIFDPNSGLYYKDEMTVDQNGTPIRLVTWYDPNTDTYNPVAYPVEQPNTQYVDNGAQYQNQPTYEQNATPPKKGKGGLIAIIVSASSLVVIAVLGIIGWQMGWFDSLFAPNGGDSVIPSVTASPMPTDEPMPTQEPSPTSEPTSTPQMDFYVDMDGAQIYYELDDEHTATWVDLYLPTLDEMYPKSLPGAEVGEVMYSFEVWINEYYAVALTYVCEETDSTEYISLYDMTAYLLQIEDSGGTWEVAEELEFDIYDTTITFWDVWLDYASIHTFTSEEGAIALVQMGDFIDNRNIAPDISGLSNVSSEEHLGSFYSYTDDIPPEYTPYIELYDDGTYYMRLNLGDQMAEGSGTYEYYPESSDGFINFEGTGEDVYFYFIDDYDTLVFTGEQYGLMNYDYASPDGAFFRE